MFVQLLDFLQFSPVILSPLVKGVPEGRGIEGVIVLSCYSFLVAGTPLRDSPVTHGIQGSLTFPSPTISSLETRNPRFPVYSSRDCGAPLRDSDRTCNDSG